MKVRLFTVFHLLLLYKAMIWLQKIWHFCCLLNQATCSHLHSLYERQHSSNPFCVYRRKAYRFATTLCFHLWMYYFFNMRHLLISSFIWKTSFTCNLTIEVLGLSTAVSLLQNMFHHLCFFRTEQTGKLTTQWEKQTASRPRCVRFWWCPQRSSVAWPWTTSRVRGGHEPSPWHGWKAHPEIWIMEGKPNRAGFDCVQECVGALMEPTECVTRLRN